MGRNQAALIDDPLTRRGVELWLERVLGFYGEKGGVDVEIIERMLILNEKTREYIYEGGFTPKRLSYERGSRRLLEETVARIVTPGMPQREAALAIMRRCRDNRDHGLGGGDWCGGSEEELLKRGAIMCNEISRVFVCLCQVAGLRARVVCSHISGHMMAEAEVDGRWWWMDPMQGCYAFKDDGSCASAWDLMQDPRLFERQTRAVWADARPVGPFTEDCPESAQANLAFRMANNRDSYFHAREAVAIGNYFAWEQSLYTFPWRREPGDASRLLAARRGEMLNRKALGWPEIYCNHYLLDERLKTRD